jgi:hypothetical protein
MLHRHYRNISYFYQNFFEWKLKKIYSFYYRILIYPLI